MLLLKDVQELLGLVTKDEVLSFGRSDTVKKKSDYLPEFVKLSSYSGRGDGISIYNELQEQIVYEGDSPSDAFNALEQRGLVWGRYDVPENTIQKVFVIHDNHFLSEKQAKCLEDGKDTIREGYAYIRKGEDFIDGSNDNGLVFYEKFSEALQDWEEEIPLQTKGHTDMLASKDLRSVDLSHSKFSGLNIKNADFRGSTLESVDFKDSLMTNTNFCNADVPGSIFENANLENAWFVGAIATAANFKNANMEATNFEDVDLTDADMSNSNLKGAHFVGAVLKRVNFNGADLTNADFRGAYLKDVSFDGAIIEGTTFDKNETVELEIRKNEMIKEKEKELKVQVVEQTVPIDGVFYVLCRREFDNSYTVWNANEEGFYNGKYDMNLKEGIAELERRSGHVLGTENMSEQELLIKALEDFKSSHSELVERWHTEGSGLDDLKSVEHYPFGQNLEEYDVTTWVDASNKELKEIDSQKKEKEFDSLMKKDNDMER